MALLSYVYTNRMNFAPLLTFACNCDSVADSEVQQQQQHPCSPRSMYSLTTAVGIFYKFVVPGRPDRSKSSESQHYRRMRSRSSEPNSPLPTLRRNCLLRSPQSRYSKIVLFSFFILGSPLAIKRSWTWRSNSSTETSPRRTPSC